MNNKISKPVLKELDSEIIAVISAAIAQLGYAPSQISSIRPTLSNNWKMAGRMLRF